MKKLLSNDTIKNLNDDLNIILSENPVNNFKLFAMKEENDKLSVTVKPSKKYNNRYHGLHPKFDLDYLKEFLLNHNVNEITEFWSAVKDLYNKKTDDIFDLIINEDVILNETVFDILRLKSVLLGRSILQMSSHFGFIIKIDSLNTKAILEKEIERICIVSGCNKNMHFEFFCGDTKSLIKIKGILPIQLINELERKFDLLITENVLILKYSPNSKNQYLRRILTFESLEYFQLVSGGVYYSGVMPRVMEVKLKCNQSSNSEIKYLTFEVCRTTFATVDMMDNSSILGHYFFNNHGFEDYYDEMSKFDSHEDLVQNQFLNNRENINQTDQREYELYEIDKLNQYLKNSFNTHTIAVSCNIKTSDDYVIAAQRQASSIDAGEYYCSANGQSEFMDENVSFYRESVYEDLPSMNYYSEYRVDLNNELKREVIAELGISVLNPEWHYLGASYLSINNSLKEKDVILKRRMHFNVLAVNRTALDFKSVLISQSKATEKFENSSLIGIKTIQYKTFFDLVKKRLKYSYEWVSYNKSRVFLVLLFFSMIISNQNINNLDIKDLVDIILLICYFIIIIFDYYKNKSIRRLKYVKSLYMPFYINGNKIDSDKLIRKISKGKNKSAKVQYHGIFSILFLLMMIHDEL